MIHNIQSRGEISSLFESFEKEDVLDATLNTIKNNSIDVMSKVLLFEKKNKKVLIHFNNVEQRFETRKDLHAVFLILGDNDTGHLEFKGFFEKESLLKDLFKFIKEKTNRAFSDYIGCEIHTHLNALDESYKNKLLEYNSEELFDYLEKNTIEIDYIKKLFKNNKKVNSSILVNKILNDKNNIVLNTNDEVIYDKNVKEFLTMCGIKKIDEIDLEHFACRYLMAIKGSEIRFSNISKIIKFLTSLNDSELKSVFEKVDDARIKKDYETIKRTIVNKWTNLDFSKDQNFII